MKIVEKDENTLSVKTSLGRIDIKDNLFNINEGKATVIKLCVSWEVKIKGIGGQIIVLKKGVNDESA